ncbi:unnamed protein product [Arctogadus glacialis]
MADRSSMCTAAEEGSTKVFLAHRLQGRLLTPNDMKMTSQPYLDDSCRFGVELDLEVELELDLEVDLELDLEVELDPEVQLQLDIYV